MVPVEVSLPDWPYDSLNLILFAEGAAAFAKSWQGLLAGIAAGYLLFRFLDHRAIAIVMAVVTLIFVGDRQRVGVDRNRT